MIASTRRGLTPQPEVILRFGCLTLRLICGILLSLAITGGLSVTSVFAQALPPVNDHTSGSAESRSPEQEQTPLSSPPSSQVLPPAPKPPEQEPERLPLPRVFIREIRIVGSTVFAPEELAQVARPYVNREINTEDLEELRRALTSLYTDQGYVNSGAYVPDQDATDGILEIYLVEGILSDIEVEGTKWFWPSYFKQRIARSAGRPLNIHSVREQLQLLLQDPRIMRLTSELRPGLQPGEAVVNVKVEEASPYQLFAEFNNFQNPTVGAPRGLGTWVHQNLLGLGDIFQFTYGRSEGVDPLIDTSYTLPFTPWETSFVGAFRRNDFTVIEAPFDLLDIAGETNIFTVGLRQPVYRTLTKELSLSVTGEALQSKTTLLDQPFNIIPGSEDGISNVYALRFGQEWLDRGPQQVIALRSRFSVGLDVFDATINEDPRLPSGQFFAWLGQAQFSRRFDPWGIQLLSRMDLQLANHRLFPLEQFPVGGRFTVRGYRENTLVRDNAFLFSIEGRVPIWRTAMGMDIIQFPLFVDVGRGWDVEIPTPPPETLASIGLGLRVAFLQYGQFNIYKGFQLNHVPRIGDTLQDYGIHINFVVELLELVNLLN